MPHAMHGAVHPRDKVNEVKRAAPMMCRSDIAIRYHARHIGG
jgi:hypothetical protein